MATWYARDRRRADADCLVSSPLLKKKYCTAAPSSRKWSIMKDDSTDFPRAGLPYIHSNSEIELVASQEQIWGRLRAHVHVVDSALRSENRLRSWSTGPGVYNSVRTSSNSLTDEDCDPEMISISNSLPLMPNRSHKGKGALKPREVHGAQVLYQGSSGAESSKTLEGRA